MTGLCKLMGHTADSVHHHNQGLDFSSCHQCGCDLIRAHEGEWTEVPRGFRVVWREFGRSGDAASVAARMQRNAPVPPRRAPRNAPSKSRRDPRGRPLAGAINMFGALTQLGKLLRTSDAPADVENVDANGQYVILLPQAGNGR
ncbi:hypothetical protein [Stakelama tenebrarum]|uniref:Uncharacterized protein n=1 Tax=Stakelama tenebrarum TaxID=2711215 RepID=A0A6G6Y5X5_9SPHN|nr:hypothetical protein [Sphingosinithalassobacter tenebrarum]QIG80354.1 hypothetical protein G5C33_11580 [Sphingosinithalassobacter tenebrarum]